MLRVMQRITEQPQWDKTLLAPDDTRLAKSHREAEETEEFLISEAPGAWYLTELRDKAQV